MKGLVRRSGSKSGMKGREKHKPRKKNRRGRKNMIDRKAKSRHCGSDMVASERSRSASPLPLSQFTMLASWS